MNKASKKIKLYHTFHTLKADDSVNVWLPNNRSIAYYVDYLRKYSPSTTLEIEDILEEHLQDKKDLTFFTISGEQGLKSKKTVFLYAQSDTLANSCLIVYNKIKDLHNCVLVFPAYRDEGAEAFFQANNAQASRFSKELLKSKKPDILLMLNDWSKEIKRVIALCRKNKVATICLQESIIDFGDNIRRMQFADHVLIQGVQTILDLKRNHYFLSGNPRYENVLAHSKEFSKKALVNSNFTYDIFEEVRDVWIGDITECLEQFGYTYRISQHPRDKGDLSQYKDKVIASNSASITEQIRHSDIVITRFSSLIHESILQKKIVIYYNPHGEEMQYDFRFDNIALFLCKSKSELQKTLQDLEDRPEQIEAEYWNNYITCHCLPIEGSPSENIGEVISNYPFEANRFQLKDRLRLFLYDRKVLIPVRKILALLKRN